MLQSMGSQSWTRLSDRMEQNETILGGVVELVRVGHLFQQ